MCGNRCSQEICDGLHPDWTGSPKAGKRGSAIWHKRSRARAAKSMVIGERMHGRGYGEYRIVLETGVQHFGARLQTDFGKRGKGEGAARQEDRSERQSMVSRFTAAWTGPAELHSTKRYTGIARSDSPASHADATGSLRTESCTEDFGRCQRENRQCVIRRVRHVWTSDAGGFTRQRHDR